METDVGRTRAVCRAPPAIVRQRFVEPEAVVVEAEDPVQREFRGRGRESAEELAQDTFLAALTDWTQSGIPQNPGAWLLTTARRRAIDALRRARMQEEKHAQLGAEPSPAPPFAQIEDIEAAISEGRD